MKLLVTGAWNCAEEQLKKIEQLGHTIVFMQNERDNLPCSYEEVEGVICNGLFLYHFIEKFSSLKYIQLTSAGYDRVPMNYIQAHGIQIYNARGVYGIPMAEFAVSGVLQLYKQSKTFYRNQEKHVWEKCRNLIELFAKTVCIVGCGNVGTECAKRFNAFGCKVIGVDLYPRIDENYKNIYALSEIEKCLGQSDVVILTLPLTEETQNMMNNARFNAMKKNSILVNIARGEIVDEIALLKALDEKLLGAVLDVFGEEPIAEENLLWTKENVIITPHNSFVGDGNNVRLEKLILKNINYVK